MANRLDILTELANVRDLLLVPGPATLALCEQRLTVLTSCAASPGDWAKISVPAKPLLRNIQFLLDKTRDFWAARRSAESATLHYSPGGMLFATPASSTFEIEV